MMHHETEGFLLVSAVEPFYGVLGDEFCGVSLLANIFIMGAVAAEVGVEVGSLVVEYLVIVKSFRVAHHVPFSDDGRLVACVLQQLAEKCLCGVYAFCQLPLSVLVAIESCDETGSGGGGDGVFYECPVKAHALAGNTVDVGRWRLAEHLAAVGADALVGMVVAHDVEYVGALVVLRGGLQCQKQQRAGEGMVRHGLLVYEFTSF